MNTLKFAQLIGYIGRQHAISFTDDDLQYILGTIDDGTAQTEPKFEPATHDQIVAAAGTQVKEMLYAMNQNKKIEAIKACRMLTGYGLKEAKDAVEWAQAPKGFKLTPI